MATLVTIRQPDAEPFALAIEGNTFVDPADADITAEMATENLWALPGLVDAHAHLTMTSPQDIRGITESEMAGNVPKTAWAHVERGVLLILDKGGGTDLSLMSLDHDADLRPIVEVAGAMIHPAGGYMPGFGVEVEGDALVAHVRDVAATRGGWVKLVGDWPRKGQGPVNNYTFEQLTEAVEVVHAAGAKVAIHTMANSASEAVAAGVDSIEHGPFLTSGDLGQLARRGGAWVPTIVNMLDVIDMLGADSTGGRMFQKGLDQMRTNLPIAEELGVTVLAGTDMAVPHGEVAIEASRLHEYGLSNSAAAKAATTAGYDYTGRTDPFTPGSQADVVFFASNPFDDVTVLERPELVIHRGRTIGGDI
ncbi:MAG: amidohydrolase family protein [Acidimicrobiia bacterium]